MKKKTIVCLSFVLLFALAGCSGASTSGDRDSVPTEEQSESVEESEATAPDLEANSPDEPGPSSDMTESVKDDLSELSEESGAEQVPEEEPEDDLTISQRNAIGAAESYLNFQGFSRQGLIHQLSSDYGEGYPEEDAVFAVDYLEEKGQVDWNEEAIESAEDYLKFQSFSRKGLIHQLSSESGDSFTEDQATHAVDYLEENGLVDWNEQAAKSAEDYLKFQDFSRDGLLDQLTSDYGEQFTREQAEYGLQAVGY